MAIRTAATPEPKRSITPKAKVRLVSRGWDALVERLGYADATRFVMLMDKGSGDSVKYFRDLWKNTSAKAIYKKVLARRRAGNGK